MKKLPIDCVHGVWWPLVFLGLLGCQEIRGIATVHQATGLYYYPHHNNQEERTFRLTPGTYSAKISWASKYQADLILPQMPIFPFVLKHGAHFPTEGTFRIRPSQNNQEREIRGKITKKVVNGALMRGQESCTYVKYDYVYEDGGRYLRRQVFWGLRQVEFILRTTYITTIFKVFDEDVSEIALAFASKTSREDKQYLLQGNCLPFP